MLRFPGGQGWHRGVRAKAGRALAPEVQVVGRFRGSCCAARPPHSYQCACRAERQPHGEGSHAPAIRLASPCMQRGLQLLDPYRIQHAAHRTTLHHTLSPAALAVRGRVVKAALAAQRTHVRGGLGKRRHSALADNGGSFVVAMGRARNQTRPMRKFVALGDHVREKRDVGRDRIGTLPIRIHPSRALAGPCR